MTPHNMKVLLIVLNPPRQPFAAFSLAVARYFGPSSSTYTVCFSFAALINLAIKTVCSSFQ